MSDEARANLYLGVGLCSLGGIIADVFIYPSWWIAVPLFVVLVADIVWGIIETA